MHSIYKTSKRIHNWCRQHNCKRTFWKVDNCFVVNVTENVLLCLFTLLQYKKIFLEVVLVQFDPDIKYDVDSNAEDKNWHCRPVKFVYIFVCINWHFCVLTSIIVECLLPWLDCIGKLRNWTETRNIREGTNQLILQNLHLYCRTAV